MVTGEARPGATTAPSRRSDRRRRAIVVTVVAALALIGLGLWSALRAGPTESGDLYFTTFRNPGLYKAAFEFKGGVPKFAQQTLVTKLRGADGVIFDPRGHLLVGGQGTGTIEEIDPSTGAVTAEPTGCSGTYLLSLNPAGDTVYSGGIPGPLCSSPVAPLRPGTAHPLSGDDTQIDLVAFVLGGQAYYTSSPPEGTGSFGLIDLSTYTTTRELSGIPAHGISYDPYTKTLLLFGGQTILQIDPSNPKQVLSSMTVPDTQLDSGTTDGHGHIFVASNFGQLVTVDYSRTGRLGNPKNTVTVENFHGYLDDIAPLVGPGSFSGTGTSWETWAAVLLGVVFLIAGGYLAYDWLWPRMAPRLSPGQQLPSWDLRRQEVERQRRRRRPERTPRRPAPKRR
jgi:hypothetical protein